MSLRSRTSVLEAGNIAAQDKVKEVRGPEAFAEEVELKEQAESNRALMSDIQQSTHWAQASTAGTMSFTHVDTGGACTAVAVREGCKLWFVGTPTEAAGNVESTRFLDGYSESKLVKGVRWECVALIPGDVLCDPPFFLKKNLSPH
jgi:hypothetical protein